MSKQKENRSVSSTRNISVRPHYSSSSLELSLVRSITDEEDEPGDVLEQAQQQIETPGQCFRLELMDDLFNSPFCTVEHHP